MFIRAHGMLTQHPSSCRSSAPTARFFPPGIIPPGTASAAASPPRGACHCAGQTRLVESAGGSLGGPRVPRVMSSVARRLPCVDLSDVVIMLPACMPSDVPSLPPVQVLYPLIESSRCITVPGAYFGDEGKGKTVDALARSSPGLTRGRMMGCQVARFAPRARTPPDGWMDG